jgi:hypothetical protein
MKIIRSVYQESLANRKLIPQSWEQRLAVHVTIAIRLRLRNIMELLR